MSFKKLIAKVKQAEDALEAKERLVAADWGQLKTAWKAAWTPGRIIIADPLRHVAKSGSWLQLFTVVSGLFASGSAQVAASEADKAAESAEGVAETIERVAEAVAPGIATQAQRTTREPVEP